MEIKLTFAITRVDGEVETQDITAPAHPEVPVDQQKLLLMMKMFNQYTQVGMLRQPKPDHYILLCPSQIMFVECELPSVLIANVLDVPPASRGGLIAG